MKKRIWEKVDMNPQPLSFIVLLGFLQTAIAQIKDPRQASNASQYSLSDMVLGAFSAFFMQCESFLEHQRQMQSRHGRDNAQSLFGLEQIPTTPQIRNILDQIAAETLFGVFRAVYQALKRSGDLKLYECLAGQLLVTLDGSHYFSSQKIQCEHCSSRKHQNGVMSYFHGAILPVIVSPHQTEVIALAPEFITPIDGSEKQDCEVAAAKRWITTHAPDFAGQIVTFLGDDLYSRQPMALTLLGDRHELYLHLFARLASNAVRLVKLFRWNWGSEDARNATVEQPL